MKTFRIIGAALLSVVMSMNLASCSSDDKEEPVVPPQSSIEDFHQTNMNFTEKAGEQTFSFTANAAWTVNIASTSGGSTWCTASPAQGGAGSQTIKITTTENDTYNDRSVTVTLKAGNESKSFVVTQKQKNAILLTSDKFEIGQQGGTFTVEVKANVNYTATIGETCKNWITEGSDTRALSATTKTYSVAANEESEKREGTITFTDGTLSETVHVYQAGRDIILLSKNEYYVDAAGEEITVELKSNCEYEVEMPDVNWIHTVSTRAMSSHTLHYTVDANTTYDSREAKIVYRNKANDVTETLTVVQAQKDAIILGQKEVTVKADGETIEVKLSANVDFEVEMPAVDWITSVSTRGLTEHTLYYNVAKNEGEDSRSAQITFTNKNSGLKDVLTVQQEPAFTVINVPTAGELPKITNRRDFKALKLTGYLNGTDVIAIKEMQDLEYLDISEARIVAGGECYDEYHKSFTADNTIGHGMFIRKTNLKQILLPDGVTTIGGFAFCDCSSLTSIHIPNSVTTIEGSAFSGCSSLTNINIPDGVTTIESCIFAFCSSLTSIVIPDGVTTIGEAAFYNCSSLTSIDIPDGVTTIGENAFNGCDNLAIVKIGTGLKSICNSYLLKHSSITEVYCYAPYPPIAAYNLFITSKNDFAGIRSDAKLYIPKGSRDSYIRSYWGRAFTNTNIIEMEE